MYLVSLSRGDIVVEPLPRPWGTLVSAVRGGWQLPKRDSNYIEVPESCGQILYSRSRVDFFTDLFDKIV
jgi:hypothetical protein